MSRLMTCTARTRTVTACERVYLTDRKLNGYVPHVGDTVDITYSRNGKPTGIQVLETTD